MVGLELRRSVSDCNQLPGGQCQVQDVGEAIPTRLAMSVRIEAGVKGRGRGNGERGGSLRSPRRGASPAVTKTHIINI